jgi:hypothetical protein
MNPLRNYIGLILFTTLWINSICPSISYGQPSKVKYQHSIEIRPKAGFLIAHREKMAHLVTSHFYSGELIYNFHTNGLKHWQSAHKNPTFGVLGTFTYNTNRDVVGQAMGAAGFIKLPFARTERLLFNSRIALGLGYLTRKFDKETNPKNNAIGSHLNLLIILGMDLQYIMKHGHLSFGVDFTHYSNSGTKKPNLGLNIPNIFLGYGVFLNKANQHQSEVPELNKKWGVLTQGLFSMNQNYDYDTRLFPFFGASVYAIKRLNHKGGVSVGLDVMYNEAHRNFVSSRPGQTPWQTFQAGVFSSYDLHVDRFTFFVGMGVYFLNQYNFNGWFFHKLGGRIDLTEKLFFTGTVKSHWAKADYFEVGLGYRFLRK